MKICDECETVAHCTKHGCIPKVSAKDAMKLALDHLMNLQPILGNGLLEERQLAFIDPHIDCAITALQGGLAEQPAQQEPIYQYQMANGSWIDQTKESHDYNVRHGQATVRVVYTSPPAQRKPLTDDEILAIGKELGLKCRLGGNSNIDFDYARAIEAKLKEKNNG